MANTARTAAREIHRLYARKDHLLLFQGHWGFQYYMEQAGAKPINFKQMSLSSGDRMVSPQLVSNPGDLGRIARELGVCAWPSCRLVTPFSMEMGAGFHTSSAGPLPYAAVGQQMEAYAIYETDIALRLVNGEAMADQAGAPGSGPSR